MEASVVVPVDPAGGGVLDVGDSAVGAVVEDGGADALGLVEAVDGLHQGVVVGVADRPDRGRMSSSGQVFGEPDRGVLGCRRRSGGSARAGRRVALAVTLPQRHPQRGHHQVGGLAGGGVPGHDPLGEHVEDERDVDQAGVRADVGEVLCRPPDYADVRSWTGSGGAAFGCWMVGIVRGLRARRGCQARDGRSRVSRLVVAFGRGLLA